MQGSLALDFVQQQGLLSTPFQRVYFSDVAESFIENFQLADAIEQLPDSRFKVAAGGRLNWYINETFVIRTFYRYYYDDWGISSHTASAEVPIKLSDKYIPPIDIISRQLQIISMVMKKPYQQIHSTLPIMIYPSIWQINLEWVFHIPIFLQRHISGN